MMRLGEALSALRPKDWIKNTFVLAPLVFSGQLERADVALRSLHGFAVFCLLSGAMYLVNDVVDREADRIHPIKARRPVASGALSVKAAVLLAAVLGAVAAADSLRLGRDFALVVAAYLALNAAYNLGLKHVVIVDVIAVSVGFVLRVLAGGALVREMPSPWILLATFFIALFLVLGRRRHEMLLVPEPSAGRPALADYSPLLLDQLIAVVTALTIITYALYAMDRGTVERFGSVAVVYTVPLVVYGIFRYLFLVHRREQGASPAESILGDRWLLAVVGTWALAVAAVIYG